MESNANLAYPTYRVVFIDGASAQHDADYWFGIWVAFLVVLVLVGPFVGVVMGLACRDKDQASDMEPLSMQ